VNKQVALAMLLMTWSYTILSAQSDCVAFRNRGRYQETVGDAYHVATGHLKGDANVVDFVLPGTFGSVAVFYGDGSGLFSGSATFPAGTYPHDVTVGDFNGDKLPDLAVADDTSLSTHGAQVLLNNGDGTFAAPVNYPTDGFSGLVVTADFNHDGKLDLALAGSDLYVLLGNGDGTFQPPITSAGPDGPGGIILGDFNQDGNLDLAISNYTSEDLRILLGDGQGHFTIAFTYSLSGNAAEVARADFNNDGHQDLAVSVFNASPNNHISVYFGNGDGSFTAGPEIPIDDPQGIAAADFNNDGDFDLAVVSPFVRQDLLVVALGDGMGNFPVVQSFPTQRGSGDARDLAVADFDGNGRKDIVTAQVSGQGSNPNIFLNVPCR